MKKKNLDKQGLQREILSYLRRNGVNAGKSLEEKFSISQPSLSRILSSLRSEILIIGKGRETKYAALREIDHSSEFPVYEILKDGASRRLGILYAIYPQGFYFLATTENAVSSIYADLPYFLNDLRPAGYLGRLVPLQNPDLDLPKDIIYWSADDCLRYLSIRGWNTVGNLIVGDKAFQLYLQHCQSPLHTVESKNRKKQYSQYANQVISMGDPGSSAGGEQAKFTTILLPEYQQVLVKFSPPKDSDLGIRIADLLIAEHLALSVLNKHGHEAADSEIISYDNRIFLEVKRFDRVGKFSRRGLISLGSLDAEFSSVANTWSSIATDLAKKKIIPEKLLEKIRFRELFGEYIANSDMHSYNLSFFTQGQQVIDLAPTYDMTCMLLMPRNYQLFPVDFRPSLPSAGDSKIWESVYLAAMDFWEAILKEDGITASFKKIARECQAKIAALKNLADLLPR